MHNVHAIIWTHISECNKLILWQLSYCNVSKVKNWNPLIYMSWQEHHIFYILPQENETLLKDLACASLRVCQVELRHFYGIHNEAWPVKPVTPMDIKTACLKESYCFLWDCTASRQWSEPFKMFHNLFCTFFLLPEVSLYEFQDIPVIEFLGYNEVLWLLQVLFEISELFDFIVS